MQKPTNNNLSFKFQASDLNQLEKICYFVKPLLKNPSILCLFGDLGSGKTTFCRKLLPMLEINENVTSPTYGYVNIYSNKKISIAHADLFRIDNTQDIMNLGIFNDIMNSDIAIIEWPQLIIPLLKQYWMLDIKIMPDHSRCLTLDMKL